MGFDYPVTYGLKDKARIIGYLYQGADGFLRYRKLRPLTAWERDYAIRQRNSLA